MALVSTWPSGARATRHLQQSEDGFQSEAVQQAVTAIGSSWPTAEIALVRSERRLGNQALAAKVDSRA